MKKITLILACCLAVACGDDDGDDTTTTPDLGRDSGTTTEDDGGMTTTPDMNTTTPDMGGGGGGLGSMCPAGDCNVVTSEGCDTAGEACYFGAAEAGADAAPLCAPAGTMGDGASCENANSCQEGFICIGEPGVCRRICCGDSDDDCLPETTGQLCSISIVDDEGMPTGVGACRLPDDCDPVAQTGCAGGDACYPSGGGAYSCAEPGPGTQGANCDSVNCAAGFMCITGDPNPICVQICNTASPVCDAAGTECGGLTGYEDIGVCVDAA